MLAAALLGAPAPVGAVPRLMVLLMLPTPSICQT
jgi:hypothetical protein